MAYCSNCGAELKEGASFCHVCGAPVNQDDSYSQSKRKQEYAGKLIKCPNCGELIDSFVSNCPSCGYEIRGASNSNAIQEFSARLMQTKTDKEKATVIRSFPIPNTKEDILEFLILASTNINENQNYDDEVSDAWVAKINQAYQKAQLTIKDPSEFSRVQNIYDKVMSTLKRETKVQKSKNIKETASEFAAALPNALIVAVWLLSLFFLETFWNVSFYASGVSTFRSLYYLDLFAGIFFIPPRCRCYSSLPKILTIVGLILSIVLMLPLGLGSSRQTALSTFSSAVSGAVVFAAIIFIRLSSKKNKNYGKAPLGTFSLIFALVCVVAFVVIYAIGIQSSSAINEANVTARDEKQSVHYEWPSSGISQYIPMPAAEYGEITKDDDSDFRMKLYKVTTGEYQDYLAECTGQGYTFYSTKTDSYYYAYNEEEYYLKVSYDEDEEIMNISLEAPMEMAEITWPNNDLTKQIPKPDYTKGNIASENSEAFSVYLSGIDSEKYNKYVEQCIAAGFSNDYYRSDDYFYGDNEEGYRLRLSKENFDKMYLKINTPKEEETEEE